MKALILTYATKIFAGVSSNQISSILSEVVAVSKEDIHGWEKAEKVVSYAAEVIGGEKAKWVVKTVVQIIYAIAKLKNPNL